MLWWIAQKAKKIFTKKKFENYTRLAKGMKNRNLSSPSKVTVNIKYELMVNSSRGGGMKKKKEISFQKKKSSYLLLNDSNRKLLLYITLSTTQKFIRAKKNSFLSILFFFFFVGMNLKFYLWNAAVKSAIYGLILKSIPKTIYIF